MPTSSTATTRSATRTCARDAPSEGIDLLRKAVAGAQAKFGERHVKTAHYTKNLATILGLQRHYAEAAALTERAVSIERELYPPGSPDVVNGLNNLGNLELTLGRLHAARDTLDEARTRNRNGGLDESLGQTFVLGNLARVHEALGDTAGALALLDEAERTATKVVGPDHARTLTLELQRARVAAMRDPAAAAATAARRVRDPRASRESRAVPLAQRTRGTLRTRASPRLRAATKQPRARPGKKPSTRCRPITSIR